MLWNHTIHKNNHHFGCHNANAPALTANIPLFGLLADLRISEIVDVPNWTVSLYFPKMELR